MDEVGDLIKYKVDFPGAVDPDGVDARNANKIGNIFADSAKKFGYNLSGKVPRITEKTEGFSDYFKSPVEKKVTTTPTVQGEPSKGLMNKLAKFGIKIGKGIGVVAGPALGVYFAPTSYREAKAEGKSEGEALAYGVSEFAPISMYDIEAAGSFIKDAREEGLPKVLGLDTEKQQRRNVLRKQRLADRVKRNTSVTSPPEEGFINQNRMGE
jgi:hypothetical protein